MDCADFWTAARDDEYGGFHSFVEVDGSVGDETAKSLVGQSRDAYGFARAFMLTGDEAYLDHAEHALQFLVEHGWDHENGGWLFAVDELGDPVVLYEDWDPNTFKWSFAQHYALLGLAATCEATRDESWCGWLDDGRDAIDDELWDPNSGGYFDEADLDWSNPTGKGFTPTVDAFTTHGLALALMGDEPAHRERALELADQMAEHLAGGLDAAQLGFPEVLDDDWAPIPSYATGQPGHVLKTAWCLGRAHRLEPDDTYLDAAVALFRDTLDHGGYDDDFGGPLYECDWSTGQITSHEKVYWVLEQGAMAGLTLHPLVADESLQADLLRVADESLGFHAAHLAEPQYGETFSRTSRDGLAVTDPTKGDAFKAGYHSVELGYYTYLYASLYLHDAPVTLFYRFDATDQVREVHLRPLPGDLSLTSVLLDGQPHDAFDATGLTLNLPAGTGGVFEATFSGS